jgi:hypothetical protein
MNIFRNWIEPIKYSKIGFEDIKIALTNPDFYILINTLSLDSQDNLINGTILVEKEEFIINKFIENYETNTIKIIIYGMNSTDNSIEDKAKQMINLGFKNVFLYYGGLFEWLLLQEIYGYHEFPTTIYNKNIDLIKYRSKSIFL